MHIRFYGQVEESVRGGNNPCTLDISSFGIEHIRPYGI
jgi:hypothetical protein